MNPHEDQEPGGLVPRPNNWLKVAVLFAGGVVLGGCTLVAGFWGGATGFTG